KTVEGPVASPAPKANSKAHAKRARHRSTALPPLTETAHFCSEGGSPKPTWSDTRTTDLRTEMGGSVIEGATKRRSSNVSSSERREWRGGRALDAAKSRQKGRAAISS